MKHRLRLFLLFVSMVGVLACSAALDAASKNEMKTFPVKVTKASETIYKQAKIVQPKESKKKRFLWFKKKETKVAQAKIAPIARVPLKTKVKDLTTVQPVVRPVSEQSIKLETHQSVKGNEIPEPVVLTNKSATD